MLTKCPECDLPISDKALSCPHCGYPLQPNINKPRAKSSKRMRLPNGFGQIVEIKGRKLRKPFRAMVSVGKKENGKPICKLLKPEAYFETYNDAYAALVEYNKNPYDLDDNIIFEQLYAKWSEEHFEKLNSSSNIRTIKSAWSRFKPIYSMRVRDIRARHIKGCIDESEASANIKSRMKSLANMLFDYAVEYELTDRNYARTFSLSDEIISELNDSTNSHIAFTENELNVLWENINVKYVPIVLIQCYTGFRPQELGNILIENVNINDGVIVGGMKTEAGIDRIVPIHPKIIDMVKKEYNVSISRGSKYLFTVDDAVTHTNSCKLTYDKYRVRFNNIVKALNLNQEHKPHDPRKTFVTMAKKYKLDEYAIKRIVGHRISDITESIYTERDIEWLKEEINKIV